MSLSMNLRRHYLRAKFSAPRAGSCPSVKAVQLIGRVVLTIEPEHYQAFRRLVPGLPATFWEWKASYLETVQEALRGGEKLIDVVVYPEGFSEFLRERRTGGSVKTLEAYAVSKATAA